ncbi:MAG TPA: FAD-binding oxidoreductase [Parafilimonas sp.]|nr:FAD-binding oxidoreductase [Parafilimonas sp.]
MTVDYIIAGQGISGTWLSYYLLKENKSIVVFDKNDPQSSSNVAGGLINPVTGRRVVTTWMAEELMPFVWKEYNAAGEFFGIKAIHQKNILAFPSATDLQQAFAERMQQQNSYIRSPASEKNTLRSFFNFPFDVFEINPCYVVQMRAFLQSCRTYLLEKNLLRNETFDETELILKDDLVEYQNIFAKKIIYADGIQSMQSRYWKHLPFVQNKGQALVIETDGLNTSNTYKFGHLTLISLEEKLWWAGSSNELSFETVAPTEDFKNRTVSALKLILKKTFEVKEHWSSLRAATVERRPFAGIHPLHDQIAILNGLGSKGCSLAPWFAKELVDSLIHEKQVNPLADVKRYSRILGLK